MEGTIANVYVPNEMGINAAVRVRACDNICFTAGACRTARHAAIEIPSATKRTLTSAKAAVTPFGCALREAVRCTFVQSHSRALAA